MKRRDTRLGIVAAVGAATLLSACGGGGVSAGSMQSMRPISAAQSNASASPQGAASGASGASDSPAAAAAAGAGAGTTASTGQPTPFTPASTDASASGSASASGAAPDTSGGATAGTGTSASAATPVASSAGDTTGGTSAATPSTPAVSSGTGTPSALPGGYHPTFAQEGQWIIDMYGGLVEPYALVPAQVEMNFGPYSESYLTGAPAKCEAFGAGYWMGVLVEEGVLGSGAAPGATSRGYVNPTLARAANPAGEYYPTQVSMSPAGAAGPQWTASCPTPFATNGGSSEAALPGLGGAGSTQTSGIINNPSGTPNSVFKSQSDLQGFDAGGVHIGLIENYLQVNLPETPNGGQKKLPTVTYHIDLTNITQGGKPLAEVGSGGINLSGTNVPLNTFTDQFDQQVQANQGALAAIGVFNLSILKPSVHIGQGVSGQQYQDPGDYNIDAPSLVASAAPAYATPRTNGVPQLGKGGIGTEQGMRIGHIHYSGTLDGPPA